MDSNLLKLTYDLPEVDTHEVFYPESTLGVKTRRASEIKPMPLLWLWKGWLLEGKLHILAGEKATGKTTIALNLAATISTGRRWPDGTEAPTGSVLIWSGEDDAADTIIPRLEVAGANKTRIHFVDKYLDVSGERLFDPARDFSKIGQKLSELRDCRLLIIDPIVSTVSGNANSNNDVRHALEPIIQIAQEHKCAVIGITHLTKNSGESSPLERVTGSLAFTAASRLVWIAAKGKNIDGEERQVLCQVASNLGKNTGGLFYEIEGVEIASLDNSYSRISWRESIEGDAQEILRELRNSVPTQSKIEQAARRIAEILTSGPKEANSLKILLADEGYSKGTIDAAKRLAGVLAVKSPVPNGPWMWQLESKNPNQDRRTQDPGIGIFG